MALDAPSLAVADLANGGGFVATITGGDPAADNLLQRMWFGGASGIDDQLQPAGISDGPGVITDAVPVGGYRWIVLSTLGLQSVYSNWVSQPITDPAAAVMERLLAATRDITAELAIPGINSVLRTKDPHTEINLLLPGVVISSHEQQIERAGGTNASSDFWKPVYVTFVYTDGHDNTTEPQLHQHQQIVVRRFNDRRDFGVPEVMVCEAGPDTVSVKNPAIGSDYLYGAVLLKFHTRESRAALSMAGPLSALQDQNGEGLMDQGGVFLQDQGGG